MLVTNFSELHQLLTFKLKQAHAHVRHFTILQLELLLLHLLVVSELAQLAEVVCELKVNLILDERLKLVNT